MAKHIALLRGINLAGKNRLPMKDLTQMFEDAGCTDVRTYIQSGNVVFSASAKLAARMSEVIPSAILKKFHISVPVIVRSADEFKAVVKGNPFLKAGEDLNSLHVAFLSSTPLPAHVAALDPNRSPGDRYVVRGADIYLCCPNGVGQTKLTNAYFDSKLKTISSGRNWRTVTTLLEMSTEVPS